MDFQNLKELIEKLEKKSMYSQPLHGVKIEIYEKKFPKKCIW